MTECVKQTRGNPIFEFYFLLYTILEKKQKKTLNYYYNGHTKVTKEHFNFYNLLNTKIHRREQKWCCLKELYILFQKTLIFAYTLTNLDNITS